MKLPSEGYPVLAVPCVGVMGWVFPRINVLDLLGLNDYVIARTPTDPSESRTPRRMAHERPAPRGYVEAFAPNVVVNETRATVVIHPRAKPLTAADIRAIEQKWGRWARERASRPWAASDASLTDPTTR